LPLSAKVSIEVYLPDAEQPAYAELLTALEKELAYTFGGCSMIAGLQGNYLSRRGVVIRDRVNVLYTDAPFDLAHNFAKVSAYADALREAALRALDEEVVLIAVFAVYHTERVVLATP
jgi:hypothetical protein